ncbi:unnamed protein product [Camellia sinensis]
MAVSFEPDWPRSIPLRIALCSVESSITSCVNLCGSRPHQQHQQQESSITSCVNQLIPCFNYLNLIGSHDNPPDSCCNPLKSVIKSNHECLCSIISIKATNAAQQYDINLTDAQQLLGRCGQHVNLIACLATATGLKLEPKSRSLLCWKASKVTRQKLDIVCTFCPPSTTLEVL